jgi:hypothetical protein
MGSRPEYEQLMVRTRRVLPIPLKRPRQLLIRASRGEWCGVVVNGTLGRLFAPRSSRKDRRHEESTDAPSHCTLRGFRRHLGGTSE